MKFTLKWLARYLKTNASLTEIVNKLNQIGLEVESVVDSKHVYGEFLVAQILSAKPHPNANTLQVCEVYNGKEILQVVCGASNARSGINVVLAPTGSIIPTNNMMIKKSAIRGVESNGMLCSAAELGIGQENEGIIELPNGKPGESFAAYYGLDDVMIEISLTPNRGDCSSVLGVARDLSASGIGDLINEDIEVFKCVDDRLNKKISVDLLEADLCSEFGYVYGERVSNGNTDGACELNILKNIGYDLKGALVDISNFVMLDLGRPNHIYDADKIKGDIAVRKSKAGEKFKAIGGIEYILPDDLLVIADQEKILSLAGVIGGEESKVTDGTNNILVELADFDAEAVMKAGRALGIITDARFRFERHIDSGNTQNVFNKILQLIKNCCGGNFSEIQIVKGEDKKPNGFIEFEPGIVSKIAGMPIPAEESYNILNKLGFARSGSGIKVPSWRIFDVTNELDLVEEVLRIYGLSNIVAQDLPYNFTPLDQSAIRLNRVQSKLLSNNMTEVIGWSFISEKIAEHFGSKDNLLLVQNPISADMGVMRPSIICSFISIVNKNSARKNNNISLFELGAVYSKEYKSLQTNVISGLRCGEIREKNVHAAARMVDFFDIKDDVISVLSEFNVELSKYSTTREVPDYYHPTKSACLKLGKNKIALFGELHPKIVAALEIGQKNVFCFEIFLDNIPQSKINYGKAKSPIFDYQSVDRDFAFLVQKEIMAADLIRAIESLKIEFIEEIKLFDVYEGQGVEPGLKSVGISIKIQPKTATMKEQEIDEISSQVVMKLEKELHATLRFKK